MVYGWMRDRAMQSYLYPLCQYHSAGRVAEMAGISTVRQQEVLSVSSTPAYWKSDNVQKNCTPQKNTSNLKFHNTVLLSQKCFSRYYLKYYWLDISLSLQYSVWGRRQHELGDLALNVISKIFKSIWNQWSMSSFVQYRTRNCKMHRYAQSINAFQSAVQPIYLFLLCLYVNRFLVLNS